MEKKWFLAKVGGGTAPKGWDFVDFCNTHKLKPGDAFPIGTTDGGCLEIAYYAEKELT